MIRDFRVWTSRWAMTPAAPSILIDGLQLEDNDYGFWRPRYARHAYRGVSLHRIAYPYAYEQGDRPDEAVFPSPLSPVDDRPRSP